MKLDPIYKWTGGKRKEIKIFSEYYPDFVKNTIDYKFIEPFFGGGAVYWSLNSTNNLINDIDKELVNFLEIMKSDSETIIRMADDISKKISEISLREKNKLISISEAKTERGLTYYEWRDKDRKKGLEEMSNIDRAFRFFLINQLAFNGMRRFNSRGEFNVPYGRYKEPKIYDPDTLKKANIALQNTEIFCADFEESEKFVIQNSFVSSF